MLIIENLKEINDCNKRKGVFYSRKENIRLKYYADWSNTRIRIQKLDNALQRGKKCQEIIIKINGQLGFENKILNENEKTFSEFVEDLLNDFDKLYLYDNFEEMDITMRELQSMKLFSPFAKVKKVNIPKDPKKWMIPYIWKGILSGQVTEGKYISHYTDDYKSDAACNFREGEKLDLLSLAKDLVESSGYWLRVKKETKDFIKIEVNLCNFSYKYIIFNK
jgi:hypothetical protein